MDNETSTLFERMLRKRLLALGVVILVVVGAGIMLWLFTGRESESIKQAAKKRTEIFRGLDTVSNLTSQRNTSIELLSKLEQRLPLAIDAVIDIPKVVKEYGSKAGARTQVIVGERRGGSDTVPASIDLKIIADGRMANLQAFAKSLETGTYYFAFDRFEINPLVNEFQLLLEGRVFIRN